MSSASAFVIDFDSAMLADTIDREVSRQLAARLGDTTAAIVQLQTEVAILKARLDHFIHNNDGQFEGHFMRHTAAITTTPTTDDSASTAMVSSPVLDNWPPPQPPPMTPGPPLSSSPATTTLTTSTASTLSPPSDAIASTTTTTTSATTVASTQTESPQPSKCRSKHCSQVIKSFAPSAYKSHLRSRMHNFGTNSHTTENRSGGVLFNNERCTCGGPTAECVPIYIAGVKLCDVENCLECGQPRDTGAARECTARLLALDAHTKLSTFETPSGQKRSAPGAGAAPILQQPAARVAAPIQQQPSAPADHNRFIDVVPQGANRRFGDYPVCILSTIASPGGGYVVRENNAAKAVRERPSDDKVFLVADVARLQRWMPHITHHNGQQLGVDAVPVAMHGFVDRFVVALCDLPRDAEDEIDFDELHSLVMSSELVLCAGRSDGWYELRRQNELDDGCLALDMDLCTMFAGRVFDPGASNMFLATGELADCDVNETRAGASFPFVPPPPQLDDNDCVLLELLFKIEQWQRVVPQTVRAEQESELVAAAEAAVAASVVDAVDALVNAVYCNDVQAVRTLLQAGVDPAARDSLALQVAAADGRLEIVQVLLADGRAKVRAFSDFAIRWSARGGYVDVVNELCARYFYDFLALDFLALEAAAAGFVLGGVTAIEAMLADRRIDDQTINYALFFAAQQGHRAVVERLLQDRRASRNAAFAGFAAGGHLSDVERLLQDARVDPAADNNYAIRSAAESGHLAVVERLLDDGRASRNAALAGFAAGGHLNDVERLLQDARVDPAADDNDAICSAAESGHLAVVERLLHDGRASRNAAFAGFAAGGHLSDIERLLQDARVDPAADDNHAICSAAFSGHLAVVDRLLQDSRVDPAANANRAIRWAAKNGHLAVVERLLQDARVDPAVDDNSAIRSAAANGHLAVVECLLQDARVDPAANDNRAIRWAAENGHLAVVECLLQDSRVDPAANANRAIRWAAKNGHLAVVERLLQDARVDPAVDDNSAIRSAAANGHLAVVERLLQDARVDPAADDNNAIRSATKNGRTRIVERLLQDERVSSRFRNRVE